MFPTMANVRAELGTLWYEAVYAIEEMRVGRPLNAVDRHRCREGTPIPSNIGPFDDTSMRPGAMRLIIIQSMASCHLVQL